MRRDDGSLDGWKKRRVTNVFLSALLLGDGLSPVAPPPPARSVPVSLVEAAVTAHNTRTQAEERTVNTEAVVSFFFSKCRCVLTQHRHSALPCLERKKK